MSDIDTDTIDSDVESRLRTALRRIADEHEPTMSASSRPSAPTPRRWPLLVAASSLLLVGVGALIAVPRVLDDPAPTATMPPLPSVATTTPDAGTIPGTLPDDASANFRFDAPLSDDLVVVIAPQPLPVVAAFQVADRLDDYLIGADATAELAALDGSGLVEFTATVIDGPIPPSFFDPAELTERDGASLYLGDAIDADPAVNALSVNALSVDTVDGGRVRALSLDPLTLGPDEFARSEQIVGRLAEVANYVNGRELAELTATDRFVPVPSSSTTAPLVTYRSNDPSNGDDIQVIRLTAPQALTDFEVGVLVEQLATVTERIDDHAFLGIVEGSGQRSYVEQVSPVDVVAIVAPPSTTDEQLLEWAGNLDVVPSDELGVEIDRFGGLDDDESVVARGESDWGRWQITTTSGGEERCLGFGAAVWPDAGARISAQQCDPANEASIDVLCIAAGDSQFAGAYVGDGELVFDDPAIVSGVSEQVTTGIGTVQPFLLSTDGQVALEVTIDGVPTPICDG